MISRLVFFFDAFKEVMLSPVPDKHGFQGRAISISRFYKTTAWTCFYKNHADLMAVYGEVYFTNRAVCCCVKYFKEENIDLKEVPIWTKSDLERTDFSFSNRSSYS